MAFKLIAPDLPRATLTTPPRTVTGPMSLPNTIPPPRALVGSSPELTRVKHDLSKLAETDFTILIQGESGSGKELVARQLHVQSPRRDGPFVAVNCAALVESLLEAELFGIEDRTATEVRGRVGKFELAESGTLFLDEVSDLSRAAQAKLLRAVQEMSIERVGGHRTRRLDVRLVVATNQSLDALVKDGRFRADLYYRLSGVEIHIPPLRHRRADILDLATHFLRRYRPMRRLRLGSSAADALLAYEWPGNVRELERVVERAVALMATAKDEITVHDLPARVKGRYETIVAPSLARDDTMRAWGSRYAYLVLERCDRNKRQACEVLGISYHTLQAYLTYPDVRTSESSQASRRPRDPQRSGAGETGSREVARSPKAGR